MNGISELLGRRRVRIVRSEVRVFRFVAVGAPMPFVFAGSASIDNDAMIAITIGDIDFVGVFIDKDLRRPPQVFDIVAAFARADLSDLHQEFSILSELHDHAVVEVTETGPACPSAGGAPCGPALRAAPRPLRRGAPHSDRVPRRFRRSRHCLCNRS